MSPNDNSAIIKQLSNLIFDRLLDDVLMDIGEKAHKEVARSRAVCSVCRTKCRSIHIPGPSGSGRPTSTNGNLTVPGSDQSGSGTSTPNSKDKSSNVYFDCMKCGQSVASNRFAPHLERCMGLNGNGSRRSAVSRAATNSKLDATLSRSNTPQLLVNGDDPPPPPSAPVRKGRPPKNAGTTPKNKKGKGNALSATPESLSNGKRPASPTPTPPKPGKKLKSEVPSPSLSSKNLPTSAIPSPAHKKTNPKVPSRLRGSPTSAPSVSMAASSPSNTMDMDLDAEVSPQSPTPSGTSESFKFGFGDRGGSTGLKTVPGFNHQRPMMAVTTHNDPDFVDLDADDQADTDSGDDDDGDDD